ncbi:MAG: 4-hydroxy-tetrahydrodipicolinate synthase [Planctomycetota bacterium]
MSSSHPRCPFAGSYVALPTPFKDGEVDYSAFQGLIAFHATHATDGIVIAGTTGEAATLTDSERRTLFDIAVAVARRRFPVIAGVGTNNTRTTIDMARHAAASGVDGVLVVTPYYNKPTQRGLVAHFSAVAASMSLPVILYNVPSRTGVDMQPETVKELGERFANIVAVKEALASAERAKRLVQETNVGVLCGEDAMIADFVSLGAVGVIGVVNNIVPREVAELVRLARPGGDSRKAAAIVERIGPLARDLFIESNPVPVKAALALMHLCREDVRLPLVTMEPKNREKLVATLKGCGVV